MRRVGPDEGQSGSHETEVDKMRCQTICVIVTKFLWLFIGTLEDMEQLLEG